MRQEQYQPYQRKNSKPSLLSEFIPFLLGLHNLTLTLQDFFRELKHKRFSGSYTLVKEAVRPLRETYRQIVAATVRFETPPGLQAQMDWGTKQVVLGSNLVTLHIFVLVLSYSRACYVVFTLDENLPTLIACHERAFRWLGGTDHGNDNQPPKTFNVFLIYMLNSPSRTKGTILLQKNCPFSICYLYYFN